MLKGFLISCAVGTAVAGPLWSRQASQQIDINWSVSGAQFKSFENPATLKQYFQSKGYGNLNIDYNQLSRGVVAVDDYFARRAAETQGSYSSSPAAGFSTLEDSPIKTRTNTTSLRGGPSYTSNTLSANATFVEGISFSDGDAATAGGAIQRATTASATSSSGASNSTATVTGNSQLAQILLDATVNGAFDRRQVDGGPKDALTGGSCAARATGASARSSIITTLNVPVNVTGSTTVANTAFSFCEAGVSAKQAGKPGGTGTSSSGTQAALTDGGVMASVVCNGRASNASPAITFNVRVRGTYASSTGFRGTFTGARTASASASCS